MGDEDIPDWEMRSCVSCRSNGEEDMCVVLDN